MLPNTIQKEESEYTRAKAFLELQSSGDKTNRSPVGSPPEYVVKPERPGTVPTQDLNQHGYIEQETRAVDSQSKNMTV